MNNKTIMNKSIKTPIFVWKNFKVQVLNTKEQNEVFARRENALKDLEPAYGDIQVLKEIVQIAQEKVLGRKQNPFVNRKAIGDTKQVAEYYKQLLTIISAAKKLIEAYKANVGLEDQIAKIAKSFHFYPEFIVRIIEKLPCAHKFPAIKEWGDCQSKIVLSYLPFIVKEANKIARILVNEHRGDDIDDLVMAGLNGVSIAFSRYKLGTGAAFFTFAYMYIMKHLHAEVRESSLIKLSETDVLEICKIQDEACKYNIKVMDIIDNDPNEKKRMRLKNLFKSQFLDVFNTGVQDTLSDNDYFYTPRTLIEHRASDGSDEDTIPENVEYSIIRKSVNALPEFERQIIKSIYWENKTLQKVACEQGISLIKLNEILKITYQQIV